MSHTFTALAFATVATLTATSAFAGGFQVTMGDDSPRQEVISVDGVNLDNPAQARAFYRSLQYAAARVCVGESRTCDKDAVSEAVGQIGSQELARLDAVNAEATQVAAVRTVTSQR
ncbi:UrcA family protein [Asticcacaulis sp. AC402]|uniref:UrcA family protein n=1 Tax=Asticcacaulis sp. AC402 TaxID=1282361 RepID=UPI0003C401DD|nr:UrcA family protein [Asticcacaulis sp. AC402]ESQ74639.1 hypothetical protein ABAC402_13420 [Asticcacaulis sp. AC402]